MKIDENYFKTGVPLTHRLEFIFHPIIHIHIYNIFVRFISDYKQVSPLIYDLEYITL